MVSFSLPMEIEKVLANEKIKEDQGRFALQRGPIVFCLEGPDHSDKVVQNIVVPQQASLKESLIHNY